MSFSVYTFLVTRRAARRRSPSTTCTGRRRFDPVAYPVPSCQRRDTYDPVEGSCGFRLETVEVVQRRKASHLPARLPSAPFSGESFETPTPRSSSFDAFESVQDPSAPRRRLEDTCLRFRACGRSSRGMSLPTSAAHDSVFKDEHPCTASHSIGVSRGEARSGRRKPPFTRRFPLRFIDSVHAGFSPDGHACRRSSDVPSPPSPPFDATRRPRSVPPALP